jgi:predicted amidohydrolase YtcJ
MAMVSIDCKAPGMHSIEALQKAVYERAATQPPGTWIRGRGYDQTRLRERRHPNRDDRDAVALDHPVIFTRTCGHIASVNSRALLAAGITDQTPDPAGGRYNRDGGRNLGVAYETAQTPLQMAALPTAEEFGDGYIQNYGRARADTMFPVKSLIAAGVPVAGSSDALVTHYAPLFGIEQALTRRTMANDICGPDECLDLTTAIRMHTINGAFASFEEGFKGGLEVGKAADLIVLAEDLSRVPVEHIRDVGVVMTVVGGSVHAKILALNRLIGGWCRYYQYTGKASTQFNKLAYRVFWALAHWLSRKFRLTRRGVMPRYLRGHTLATPNTSSSYRQRSGPRGTASSICNPTRTPHRGAPSYGKASRLRRTGPGMKCVRVGPTCGP